MKCVDAGYGSVRAADLGTPQQVGRLIASNLVLPRSGTLTFALDILTEWFAAHALAEAEVDIDGLVSDLSRLERWRYPLAIAAGLFPHEVVSKLLHPLASRQPGFASQVVDEAMARYASPYEADLPAAPPPLDAGKKIREAMMSWVSGLGPLLAKLVAPVNAEGRPFPVAVRSSGVSLILTWDSTVSDAPDVSEIPLTVNLRDLSFQWATPASTSAWAWSWTLDNLTDRVKTVIERRQLPPLAGPLLDEEVWHQAMILDRTKGGLLQSRIPLRELRESVRPYSPYHKLGHWNGRSYDFVLLRERIDVLDAMGEEQLTPPWPAPDHPLRGRFFWSAYSIERIRERTRAVLEGALMAYQQLVEAYFPKFREQLPLAGLLPLRLALRFLSTEDPAVADKSPFVQWYFEPLAYGNPTHVTVSVGALTVEEIEREVHWLSDHIRKPRPERWRWLPAGVHRGGIDVFGDRPATALAYAWLRDDLKAIHWLS